MIRNLNGALAETTGWLSDRPGPAAIELMLRLAGLLVESFADQASAFSGAWQDLVGRTFGDYKLRDEAGSREELILIISAELRTGRPAALLRQSHRSDGRSEEAWVLVGLNEIKPDIFLDALRPHPDSSGTAPFLERKVFRLNDIPASDLLVLLRCEPLIPQALFRPKGRPRKEHLDQRRSA